MSSRILILQCDTIVTLDILPGQWRCSINDNSIVMEHVSNMISHLQLKCAMTSSNDISLFDDSRLVMSLFQFKGKYQLYTSSDANISLLKISKNVPCTALLDKLQSRMRYFNEDFCNEIMHHIDDFIEDRISNGSQVFTCGSAIDIDE